MNVGIGLDHCLSFINLQLQPADRAVLFAESAARGHAVTISRQAGCGALEVAEKLAKLLQAYSPKAAPPWTVFDRNLMDKVLEDHHLPARLAKFLPEDRASHLQDILDDLFGFRPASGTVVQQASETILHLAEMGHVILIGRGATVITAKLPDVFHVRLVAPLEKRIEHAHEFYNMSKKAARDFIQREDTGRQRYLSKYFNTRIDDPLLYHLIINTGLVSYDEAARMIAEAVVNNSPAARR
ncbi:MAG: cytidylate kinase-like family protein [Verrucomicrobia bacterium]|jgi:cytidylate kinase|nr:cytidylate kinase-like family protein [Verrucomicrobiota bacterium]